MITTITSSDSLLILPIGVSGSGKSTLYKNINIVFPDVEFQYHSMDALRLEWYSEIYSEAFELACQDKQFESKVKDHFRQLLENNKSIYVDNMNLTVKRRKFYINAAKEKGYKSIACLMTTGLSECIVRQEYRNDKKLEKSIVENQFRALTIPSADEVDYLWNVPDVPPNTLRSFMDHK